MEGQQLSTPRAYMRSPTLSNLRWYKDILISRMVGTADKRPPSSWQTTPRGTSTQ
jgi:hypothetical protein